MKYIIILSLFFIGCASVNAKLTPGAKVHKSDFDGAVNIYQEPVSAANSLKEHWNTLGFRWTSKLPDTILMIAGTNGVVNIDGLQFKADGQLIEAKLASNLTDYGKWSKRQFKVTLNEFQKIATADIVKMRIIHIDTYSDSSFGKKKSMAIVNKKFDGFLNKVAEHKK